jgi:hypothetical protein
MTANSLTMRSDMAYEIVARVGPATPMRHEQVEISMMSRALFALAVALAVALGVAACVEPIEDLQGRRAQPDLGRYPQEPPTFSPVRAGGDDCGACIRNEFGLCRLNEGSYCPGLPREITEECMYEVPCDERCCDRFPIAGGVALVRPGARLWDQQPHEQIEVARIPERSGGLLVRVANIYELEHEDERVEVEIDVQTLGLRPPTACKGVVEDLDGVVLRAHVDPRDLQPVPQKTCLDAVYALGEPDSPGYAYDGERYKFEFDEGPYGDDVRVIKAWTLFYYPTHPSHEPYGNDAGQLFKHIVLGKDEPIERDDDMLCYRLPGILRPRVCSRLELVHNAPPDTP